MPTYQYACTSDDCGLRFERVQAFTDPAVTECPDCSERVRKVYGSVGVVFKGSGFYRNDSRDTKAAGGKSDSAAKSGDAGKSTDSGKGGEAAKSGTTSSESSSGKSTGDSGSSGKASTPAAVAS
jgi:putative FmdB family regulatory protein